MGRNRIPMGSYCITLLIMIMSILKAIGLKPIADQQYTLTNTDVQYNDKLEVGLISITRAGVRHYHGVAVREPLSTAYVISGAGKPTSGGYFPIYRASQLPSAEL